MTHYKLMAFVLGAFWAGMAGTLYAAKMTTIAPESFNFMESVIIFAVVILSGGSQLGVLVSAFLFIGLTELLREFSGARMLIFGLAMMLMIAPVLVSVFAVTIPASVFLTRASCRPRAAVTAWRRCWRPSRPVPVPPLTATRSAWRTKPALPRRKEAAHEPAATA